MRPFAAARPTLEWSAWSAISQVAQVAHISSVTFRPQSSVLNGDPGDVVVQSEPSLGHGLRAGGSNSVLRFVNAHIYMISPIGHGPRFARKEPLRGPHAGREPLPNPFDAVRQSCQSSMHVPRCDERTASPSPSPRRLPTAGSRAATATAALPSPSDTGRSARGPELCPSDLSDARVTR